MLNTCPPSHVACGSNVLTHVPESLCCMYLYVLCCMYVQSLSPWQNMYFRGVLIDLQQNMEQLSQSCNRESSLHIHLMILVVLIDSRTVVSKQVQSIANFNELMVVKGSSHTHTHTHIHIHRISDVWFRVQGILTSLNWLTTGWPGRCQRASFSMNVVKRQKHKCRVRFVPDSIRIKYIERFVGGCCYRAASSSRATLLMLRSLCCYRVGSSSRATLLFVQHAYIPLCLEVTHTHTHTHTHTNRNLPSV